MVRTVLYGGSFDPPHVGHLILASAALEQCGAQKLVFVPAARSPFKVDGPVADGAARFRLISAAIAHEQRLVVDDFEIARGGVSYSWQTVAEFARREGVVPGELGLLIGQDQLNGLHNWSRFDYLNEEVTWLICRRPGSARTAPVQITAAGSTAGQQENVAGGQAAVDTLQPQLGRLLRYQILATPIIEISSSEIRARIVAGNSVRYYVPDAVYDILQAEGLYRQ